ncbi:MAG: DUF2304 domain-containing protein [Mycoplasmatota bacterium]
MNILLKLELLLFVILFLFTVLMLIRSNKVTIRYAFVWFFVGFAMLLLALFPEIIIYLSDILGFVDPLNMLFIFAIFLLFCVCISLTVIVSSQTKKIRLLIQEVSLIKSKIK